MLLGRLGSAWGWWNAEGAVFDVLGLVAAVWAAAYSASARALRGVTDDIAKIDDRLRTVGDQGERTVEILERIERLLTERLPLQSASPLPAADQGSEARSTLSRWLPWSRQRRTPVSPTPPSPPTSASGSPDLALALVVAGAIVAAQLSGPAATAEATTGAAPSGGGDFGGAGAGASSESSASDSGSGDSGGGDGD
jgi:hypothetical protein